MGINGDVITINLQAIRVASPSGNPEQVNFLVARGSTLKEVCLANLVATA